MKLTFLGTRGYVKARNRRHRRHSSALVAYRGARLTQSLVRPVKGGRLAGHTTIRAQLGWCGENEVPEAVFTHCGRPIVEGDERTLGAKLRRLAHARGVPQARFAHDGLEIVMR